MIDSQKVKWTTNFDTLKIPQNIEAWLIDQNSLTEKLKCFFSDFKVEIIKEGQGKPYANEEDLISKSQSTFIREVNLLGNNQIIVFARSIIPMFEDTLSFKDLKNKPLGEILFNHSGVQRGNLEVASINGIWGRRSQFFFNKTTLLVSEFFLKIPK